MSLDVGGSGSGPRAEINVTPMADIMIVLLVIFMVTMPVIAASGVTLPPAAHARDRGATHLVVVLKADRSLAIEGCAARDLGAVSSELRERLDRVPEGGRVVHLKADTSLGFAEVRRVMELLGQLGANQIALVTTRRSEG
jgi:biopolymer transport protein TolR